MGNTPSKLQAKARTKAFRNLFTAIKQHEHSAPQEVRKRVLHLVKKIRKTGACISDGKNHAGGDTPLEYAVIQNSEDSLRVLLEHGEPHKEDVESARRLAEKHGVGYLDKWMAHHENNFAEVAKDRATEFVHAFAFVCELKRDCYKKNSFGQLESRGSRLAKYGEKAFPQLGTACGAALSLSLLGCKDPGTTIGKVLGSVGGVFVTALGDKIHGNKVKNVNAVFKLLKDDAFQNLVVAAGVGIFNQFQQYFMSLSTHKWSRRVAPLAIEAMERLMNFVSENSAQLQNLGCEALAQTEAVEWFVKGSPKVSKSIPGLGSAKWGGIIEQAGVVIQNKTGLEYYVSGGCGSDKFGFRLVRGVPSGYRVLETPPWNAYKFCDVSASVHSEVLAKLKLKLVNVGQLWEQVVKGFESVTEKLDEMHKDLHDVKEGVTWMVAKCSEYFVKHESRGPHRLMPQPFQLFFGREAELERLGSILEDYDYAVVTGFYGVGKSELVLKYADLKWGEGEWNAVWVNCEDLVESFCGIHASLFGQMGVSGMDTDMVVGRCHEALKHFRTVYILDNATSYEQIKAYLPPPSSCAKVIITSGVNEDWHDRREVVGKLEVKNFELDEAVQFLVRAWIMEDSGRRERLMGRFEGLKSIDFGGDEVVLGEGVNCTRIPLMGLRELASRLDCSPLALQQAREYFNKTHKLRSSGGQFFEAVSAWNAEARERVTDILGSPSGTNMKKTSTSLLTCINMFLESLNCKACRVDRPDVIDIGNPNFGASPNSVICEVLDVVAYMGATNIPEDVLKFLPVLQRLIPIAPETKRVTKGEKRAVVAREDVKKLMGARHELLQESLHVLFNACVMKCGASDVNSGARRRGVWNVQKLLQLAVREDHKRDGSETECLRKALEVLQHVNRRNVECHHRVAGAHAVAVWEFAIDKVELVEKYVLGHDYSDTKYYTTFFHVILESGGESLVDKLLGYVEGVDEGRRAGMVGAKRIDGRTPVHLVAQAGNLGALKWFLERGGNKTKIVGVGDTMKFVPLHLAARAGRLGVVKHLVEECRANINAKTKDGFTPLHFAVKHGHVEVVSYLLEKQAAVNTSTKFGYTPLHEAMHAFGRRQAYKGSNLDVIRTLIRNGADVNFQSKDKGMFTPLHIAVMYKSGDLVRVLLGAVGVNTSLRNAKGETVQEMARNLGFGDLSDIHTRQNSTRRNMTI